MNVGVAILRLKEGLDCSDILADIDQVILNKSSGEASNSLTGSLSPNHETSFMNNNSNNEQLTLTDTSVSSSTIILLNPEILKIIYCRICLHKCH